VFLDAAVDVGDRYWRDTIRGRDIQAWRTQSKTRMLWPYDEQGAVLARLPKILREHFESHASILIRRADYRGGVLWQLFRTGPTLAAHRQTEDRQIVPASSLTISAPDSPSPAGPRNVDGAIARAAEWLALFPEENLRFDAAVGLWHIRQLFDSKALGLAWTRAEKVADRDDDNPLRRFWDATATSI